jgi:hypothetical protein
MGRNIIAQYTKIPIHNDIYIVYSEMVSIDKTADMHITIICTSIEVKSIAFGC